jgi:hypothetical protein
MGSVRFYRSNLESGSESRPDGALHDKHYNFVIKSRLRPRQPRAFVRADFAYGEIVNGQPHLWPPV